MKKIRARILVILALLTIKKLMDRLFSKSIRVQKVSVKKANKKYLKLLKGKPGRENVKEAIKI